jgi:hypothetical protein
MNVCSCAPKLRHPEIKASAVAASKFSFEGLRTSILQRQPADAALAQSELAPCQQADQTARLRHALRLNTKRRAVY